MNLAIISHCFTKMSQFSYSFNILNVIYNEFSIDTN